MSKDSDLKTPFDKNNYNSTIKKLDISGTITSTDVNKADKSINNNIINKEKIDDEKKALNNQNAHINNQQILSRPKSAIETQISQSSIDNMSNVHKDNLTNLESVLSKKEIKHEKIKLSTDNNLTEKK